MTNPATSLADLLASWDVPQGGTVIKARGGRGGAGLKFWRTQVQAVELLAEVDRNVDALEYMGENVAHIREDLPRLYQAVFGYNPPWRGQGGQGRPATPAAPRESISTLRTLGILIERYLAQEITPEASDKLLMLLDDAVRLVTELDVDDRTKHYLFDLISDARRAVHEAELFGAARIRSSYMALTTELNGQGKAAQVKDPGSAVGKKIAAWVGATMLALGVAFGSGIGEGAADWVVGQATDQQQISTSDGSDATDAEVVEESAEGDEGFSS